jgi:hypothetical protein
MECRHNSVGLVIVFTEYSLLSVLWIERRHLFYDGLNKNVTE